MALLLLWGTMPITFTQALLAFLVFALQFFGVLLMLYGLYTVYEKVKEWLNESS